MNKFNKTKKWYPLYFWEALHLVRCLHYVKLLSLTYYTEPDVENCPEKKCWSNGGPPSAMLAQHHVTIMSMYRICWVRFISSSCYPYDVMYSLLSRTSGLTISGQPCINLSQNLSCNKDLSPHTTCGVWREVLATLSTHCP